MRNSDDYTLNSLFSTNFVVISGDVTIKSALIISAIQNPEYLVISTKEGNTPYRYVIPSYMLITAVEKLLPSPFSLLSIFLKLDKNNADKCIVAPGNSLDDPETKDIIAKLVSNEGFLILIHDNEIIGVIDTMRKKALSERKYLLKELPEGSPMPSFYSPSLVNLERIASLYLSQGVYDAAQFYYNKVFDLYLQRFGDNHPYVVRSMIALADLYYSYNDPDQATYFCKRAWNISRENISKWQYMYELGQEPFMTVLEILTKLAASLAKIGLDSLSRDVYLKIYDIQFQIKNISKKV